MEAIKFIEINLIKHNISVWNSPRIKNETGMMNPHSMKAVSYTHLDVYKRQILCISYRFIRNIASNVGHHKCKLYYICNVISL